MIPNNQARRLNWSVVLKESPRENDASLRITCIKDSTRDGVYLDYMISKEKVYARSVIFGIEDSLVSTTGLIVGLAVATSDKHVVIVGGIVAIAVEAISMGAGEYLSEDAIEETSKSQPGSSDSLKSGGLMFISYLLAGLIPILPIIFFDYPVSIYLSVTFAFIGLFLLGYIKGRVLHTNPIRGALRILIVGGLATILGIIVGIVFKV